VRVESAAAGEGSGLWLRKMLVEYSLSNSSQHEPVVSLFAGVVFSLKVLEKLLGVSIRVVRDNGRRQVAEEAAAGGVDDALHFGVLKFTADSHRDWINGCATRAGWSKC
jgi:hypothetical protein